MSGESEAIVITHGLGSLAYTVIKAIVFGGYRVRVYMTQPEVLDVKPSGFARRLFATEGVVFPQRDMLDEPYHADRCVVLQLPDVKRFKCLINDISARCLFMTVVTLGDKNLEYFAALRKQKFELSGYCNWLRKIDRVVYKDGYYSVDIYGLIRKRSILGFDAHSFFLHDVELFRNLHESEWAKDSVRPISVNFIGCVDPDRRREILDRVRVCIKDDGSAFFRKKNFWLEYSDDAPGGLPPDGFLEMLRASDFTLAPKGFSLVTHRPVEAMLCGSIPILCEAELDLYGFSLIDGDNCIAVHGNDWSEALERAAVLSEEEITEMRRSIRLLACTELQYEQLSKGIRGRLGFA